MLIQLLKTACGAAALCVNRQLILEGDAEDDSAKLAEQTAERLAEAVGAPLQVLPLAPATADWNWPALIAAHVPPVTAAWVEDEEGRVLVGKRPPGEHRWAEVDHWPADVQAALTLPEAPEKPRRIGRAVPIRGKKR